MIFTILETYCDATGQDTIFEHPDIKLQQSFFYHLTN
jgi:hypothetical protein